MYMPWTQKMKKKMWYHKTPYESLELQTGTHIIPPVMILKIPG